MKLIVSTTEQFMEFDIEYFKKLVQFEKKFETREKIETEIIRFVQIFQLYQVDECTSSKIARNFKEYLE